MAKPFISYVIPAFMEAKNLPEMCRRVRQQEAHASDYEVIVVDDNSRDGSFAVVQEQGRADPRIKAVRLARNSGSHMALLCGIHHARGEVVIALAADGQDPPEFVPELLEQWRAGAHVVWATRGERQGTSLIGRAFSRLYWLLMNKLSSVKLPPSGADFFLLDRRVAAALRDLRERNTSIIALIAWLGFNQVSIPYVKEKRMSGRSKWTLRKKFGLVLDSLLSFSTAPLKASSILGLLFAGLGFVYAFALILNKLTRGALFGELAMEGWSALMVVTLVTSGTLMLMLGVIGEYLWRALEETRARPRFPIEASVNLPDSP